MTQIKRRPFYAAGLRNYRYLNVVQTNKHFNLCFLLQFLAILAAVFLLQIAAGVVGYVFTDMVTFQKQCCKVRVRSSTCDNAVVSGDGQD